MRLGPAPLSTESGLSARSRGLNGIFLSQTTASSRLGTLPRRLKRGFLFQRSAAGAIVASDASQCPWNSSGNAIFLSQITVPHSRDAVMSDRKTPAFGKLVLLSSRKRTKNERNSTFEKRFCLKKQLLTPGMLLSEAENPMGLIQGVGVFEARAAVSRQRLGGDAFSVLRSGVEATHCRLRQIVTTFNQGELSSETENLCAADGH
jgi:hypothetical protein